VGTNHEQCIKSSPFFDETVLRKTFLLAFILLIGWGVIFIYAACSLFMMEGITKHIQFIQEGIIFGLLSGLDCFQH
jgi:hypothetical protein